jgi:hypothetical protein
MEVEPMHPELNLLPKFRIVRVTGGETPQYEGVFDVEMGIKDGEYCYLISQQTAMVEGNCGPYDPRDRTAVFRPLTGADCRPLVAGATYAFIDGYWGERLELLLKRARSGRE